jgi:peptide-methionine (S)-S-oxide reductase
MGLFSRRQQTMVDGGQALPGRETQVLGEPTFHEVFGTELHHTPAGSQVAYFAMGCFWGDEQMFWQTPGVTLTAAGYAAGFTPNPTYEEVCSGRTGHAETVMVCYDPATISYAQLLKIFFENHDPTQKMRQGNDIGSQYRSMIIATDDDQLAEAKQVRDEFQTEVTRNGYGEITTDIVPDMPFYYAEDYHQQYLIKVPNGYCPVHATGVTCNVA